MSNPTERDLVRARRDAQIDHRTQIRDAEMRGKIRGEKDAKLEVAKGMKAKGYPTIDIMELTGISASEVAAL